MVEEVVGRRDEDFDPRKQPAMVHLSTEVSPEHLERAQTRGRRPFFSVLGFSLRCSLRFWSRSWGAVPICSVIPFAGFAGAPRGSRSRPAGPLAPTLGSAYSGPRPSFSPR